MKVEIGGTEYDVEFAELLRPSLGEARALKAFYGLSGNQWERGLINFQNADPDVIAGVVFLLRRRAGEPLDLDAIDALPLGPVYVALVESLVQQRLSELPATDAEKLEAELDAAAAEESPVDNVELLEFGEAAVYVSDAASTEPEANGPSREPVTTDS